MLSKIPFEGAGKFLKFGDRDIMVAVDEGAANWIGYFFEKSEQGKFADAISGHRAYCRTTKSEADGAAS